MLWVFFVVWYFWSDWSDSNYSIERYNRNVCINIVDYLMNLFSLFIITTINRSYSKIAIYNLFVATFYVHLSICVFIVTSILIRIIPTLITFCKVVYKYLEWWRFVAGLISWTRFKVVFHYLATFIFCL